MRGQQVEIHQIKRAGTSAQPREGETGVKEWGDYRSADILADPGSEMANPARYYENLERSEKAQYLVAEIGPELLIWLSRKVQCREDAADILSQCLETLWKKQTEIPFRLDEARAWFYRIAHNHLLHHYRSESRKLRLADRLREAVANRVEYEPQIADSLTIVQLLEQLNEIEREIITLVHWENFTLAQVSKILQIPESTVRYRYQKTCEKLRQML